MIDHTGVSCTQFDVTKTFYEKALAPLGYGLIVNFPRPDGGHVAGFGETATGKPDFWIVSQTDAPQPVHTAIRAETRAAVDAFYAAAIAAGGVDNGGPGLRPHYHANYYGAFVKDPDGHNIEAVCHVDR